MTLATSLTQMCAGREPPARPQTIRLCAPVPRDTPGTRLSAVDSLRRETCAVLTHVDPEPTVRLALTGQDLTGQCVPVLLDTEEILWSAVLEVNASTTVSALWTEPVTTTTAGHPVTVLVDRTLSARLVTMEPSVPVPLAM